MKKFASASLLLTVAAFLPTVAGATVVYDSNLSSNVITGNGIANGGFAVETEGAFEVGLRARVRYPDPTNQTNVRMGADGAGTEFYNHAVGGHTSGNLAAWNFDWSINVPASDLNPGRLKGFSYELGIDYNPGIATTFLVFDPVNVTYADHSFGDNDTPQSEGVEILRTDSDKDTKYSALLEEFTLVQNSWNLGFFRDFLVPPLGFDPDANGQYSIYLLIRDGNETVARTSIEVVVGSGAPTDPNPIPEPGTLALASLGLMGAWFARRRRS